MEGISREEASVDGSARSTCSLFPEGVTRRNKPQFIVHNKLLNGERSRDWNVGTDWSSDDLGSKNVERLENREGDPRAVWSLNCSLHHPSSQSDSHFLNRAKILKWSGSLRAAVALTDLQPAPGNALNPEFMSHLSPFLVQGTHRLGHVSYKSPALDDDKGAHVACHNTPYAINLIVHEPDGFPRARLMNGKQLKTSDLPAF